MFMCAFALLACALIGCARLLGAEPPSVRIEAGNSIDPVAGRIRFRVVASHELPMPNQFSWDGYYLAAWDIPQTPGARASVHWVKENQSEEFRRAGTVLPFMAYGKGSLKLGDDPVGQLFRSFDERMFRVIEAGPVQDERRPVVLEDCGPGRGEPPLRIRGVMREQAHERDYFLRGGNAIHSQSAGVTVAYHKSEGAKVFGPFDPIDDPWLKGLVEYWHTQRKYGYDGYPRLLSANRKLAAIMPWNPDSPSGNAQVDIFERSADTTSYRPISIAFRWYMLHEINGESFHDAVMLVEANRRPRSHPGHVDDQMNPEYLAADDELCRVVSVQSGKTVATLKIDDWTKYGFKTKRVERIGGIGSTCVKPGTTEVWMTIRTISREPSNSKGYFSEMSCLRWDWKSGKVEIDVLSLEDWFVPRGDALVCPSAEKIEHVKAKSHD